ncbi:hypothetical protein D4R86_02370 [bacterium]|nr:MAG: hypothetical protein D4R86_02370 [bacterium]
MFGFIDLCSQATKFLINGVNCLIHKIRQYRIERARRLRDERYNLARIMVEPLQRSLDYQSIGRQLLMVEDLPQAGYARYVPAITNHRYESDTCSICGGMGDNCTHRYADLSTYSVDIQRVFDEADRANDAVQLDFDEELDRDTNSAYREYQEY